MAAVQTVKDSVRGTDTNNVIVCNKIFTTDASEFKEYYRGAKEETPHRMKWLSKR